MLPPLSSANGDCDRSEDGTDSGEDRGHGGWPRNSQRELKRLRQRTVNADDLEDQIEVRGCLLVRGCVAASGDAHAWFDCIMYSRSRWRSSVALEATSSCSRRSTASTSWRRCSPLTERRNEQAQAQAQMLQSKQRELVSMTSHFDRSQEYHCQLEDANSHVYVRHWPCIVAPQVAACVARHVYTDTLPPYLRCTSHCNRPHAYSVSMYWLPALTCTNGHGTTASSA